MSEKILIIDDAVNLLEELCDILVMEGYDVHAARDAYQGMNMIKNIHPDLVITDLHMPQMDGYNLIANLKSAGEFKDIPIIVLSGNEQQLDIKKAFELKADLYIKKPSSAEELVISIRSLLGPK